MKQAGDHEMMVIEVHEVFFNNSFAKNFSEYLLHYIQTSLVPFNLILYPHLFSKLALKSTSRGQKNWKGFPDSSVGKESTCNEGDPGSIPGLGRFAGEGNAWHRGGHLLKSF